MNAGDRRGFALLAAVAFLVTISALSLEFTLRLRQQRLALANASEAAQAREAAAAGLAFVESLLTPTRSRSAAVHSDASARLTAATAMVHDTLAFTSLRATVSLRDAGSCVALNLASEEELRRFFVALHVDAGRADRLAQATADWRDTDDLHRARGAEAAEYRSAGLARPPANRSFRSVAELRDVLGMDDALFERVEPYLTVLGSGTVNLNTASAPVLLSLPGLSEEAVGSVMRQRQIRPLGGLTELVDALSPGARGALLDQLPLLSTRAVFRVREIEARSTGWISDGIVRHTEQVLFVDGAERLFRATIRHSK